MNGLQWRFLTAKEAWMLPCLLCLLALAGCSGSEGVEPTPKTGEESVITFMGNLADDKEETRAATPLKDLKQQFQVWGYKNDAIEEGATTPYNYTSYQMVMPNYIVNYGANTAYTTTSNTDGWEYVGQGTDQTIKYWDMNARAYRFFGYTQGTATSPATPDAVTVSGGTMTDVPTGTTVTFSSTVNASTDETFDAAPYFTRLWFSTGNITDYPTRLFGRPVQLEFLKPFARVRFMFTFVEGLSFGREALKNIKFHPTTAGDKIATAGTVTVSYPLKGTETKESWTTASTTGIDQFEIDYYETPATLPPYYTPGSAATAWPNTPEKWYTVLPAATQGSYTLEVSIISKDIKSIVIPAEYMSWEAGYEYTYKFKVTESGGITIDIVQVAINDWSNKQSSDHTVYNW